MTHLEATLADVQAIVENESVSVCIGLTVSGFISLGYDQGEVITRERFIEAVALALGRLIIDSDGELIDASYVESVERA